MKIHKDKIEAALETKERFNPYQTGHGVWKSKKHPNRNARKNALRKEISRY